MQRRTAASDCGSSTLPRPRRNDPRARIYIVDHLAPGTVIHRRVEVSNTTDSIDARRPVPRGRHHREGSFLGAAGHTPNDVSAWTSVDPGASDIPAGGRVTATVTITVPDDAPPGSSTASCGPRCARRPSPAAASPGQPRRHPPLPLGGARRGARRRLHDRLATAERSPDGQPIVLATVHNTGGRALDMSGTLRLSAGPGGLSAGPFPASLGTTLPIGATAPVTIVWTAVPAGPWDARIALRKGLLDAAARATVAFPAIGAAPSV